jgi:hypothetical protein
MRIKSSAVWTIPLALLLLLGLGGSRADAALLPFRIFTTDGQYYDDPGVDLYVDVRNGGSIVDFIFYNDSTVDCSIARIYFDGGSFLGVNSTTNGPGTHFDKAFPGPGDLPAGNGLIPPFVADGEFTIGAVAPPPKNGVNNVPAGEWVKITFELSNGGTLEGVLYELYTGDLRVGLHVIGFPDGSSNSAILVPEPATIILVGLAGAIMLRKRKA